MNNRDINVELKDEIINISLPYADRGLPGKSAYELAVEAGFIGTEEEWRASLKGDTGETPDIEIGTVVTGSTSSVTRRGTDENPIFDFVLEKGDTGPQGETGATGPQGQTGLTPNIQIGTVSSGDAPAVTRTGSDEEPIFNFVLEKGPKPVKGVDYYTEQDKEEIIDDVTGDALSIFNQNAAQKTDNFNYNATSKITEFNTNATTKTTDFNDNASLKTTEFNTNAQNKTDEFNENKEALQKELDEVHEELDRYKMLENALPKVTGTGTEVTLNDTANAPMKMSLGASELEQLTTTGINLLPIIPSGSVTNYGVTLTSNGDGSFTLNGKATQSGLISFQLGTRQQLPNQAIYVHLRNPQTIRSGIYFSDGNISSTPVFNSINRIYSSPNLTNMNLLYVGANLSEGVTYNNFTFTPSLELTDEVTDYEPYTNGASPNPDYPQDIHTINGDNEIKVENLNLWDEKWELGAYNDRTGTKTGHIGKIRNKYPIKIKPNTLYYVKTPIALNAYYYDSNMNFVFSQVATGINGQFTSPANSYYMNFSTFGSSTTTYNNNICINKFNPSINNNYYPHQEQTLPLNLGDLEYCKIGDYEDEFVIPSGKNLFNSEMEMGVYAYADGEKATNAQYIRTKELTKVEPSEQYSISFEGVSPKTGSGFLFYKDGVYVSNIQTVAKTFEVPANANQVAYNLYIGSSASPSAIYKIQIEKGTATEYEPYNDGKWYLKKNIGKVDLGTLIWVKEEESGIGQFRASQFDMLFMGKLISDIFIWQEGNVIYNGLNNGRIAVTNSQAIPIVRVRNEQYSSTSATDFKTEMNNKIVYFQRYTPTYILLNDTLQTQLNNIYNKVLAYNTQTNISQVNNDLPFRLKLSAIRDMSNIFELIENNSSTSSTLSSPLSTPNLVSSTSIIEPDVSTTDVVDNTSEI